MCDIMEVDITEFKVQLMRMSYSCHGTGEVGESEKSDHLRPTYLRVPCIHLQVEQCSSPVKLVTYQIDIKLEKGSYNSNLSTSVPSGT